MGNAPSEPAPTSLTGPSPKRDFTLDELKEFDGKTPETPIYVSVRRKVFDLSSKREFYGPGGSYSTFAGNDASRCLGLNETDKENASNYNYTDLDPESIARLNNWENFYLNKYPCIGYLVIPGEDIGTAF